MREELARPFADADAPDVEEVRAGDAVLLAEPSRVPLVGNVDAHPDDLVRDPLVSKAAPHHAPLLLGVVGDRARTVEHRLVRGEADRRLFVRGGDEDRALRHEGQTEDGRVVDVREEEHVVVLAAAFEQEVEELGRIRSLRVDERALVVEGVPSAERPSLVELEVPRARTLDWEPPDGHAVDLVEAGREVALPREVIGRVRGRDLDREMRPQALDDGARVSFGTARYVAVALHDDEEARLAQLATKSTSCSSRVSNAGQAHSASTYSRPD